MIYPNPYTVTSSLINYIATSSTASNLYTRSFGTGEDSDQAVDGNDIYPRVFLEQPFQMDKVGNMLKWNLALNITDLILHERTDEIPAMDLCLGIGNAILNKFSEDKIYSLDPNINYLELSQYNDDLTTGWRLELTLIQPWPFDRCDAVLLTGSTYLDSLVRDIIFTSITNNYSSTTYTNDFLESGSTGAMSFQLRNGTNQTYGDFGITLGNNNITSGASSVILNGTYNQALSPRSTVLNGSTNYNSASMSFIGGGLQNTMKNNPGSSNAGYYSWIGNGLRNYLSAYRSTIANGYYNRIVDAGNGTILNGTRNRIVGGIGYSTILNGYYNAVGVSWNLIGTGRNNTINNTGPYSTILNGKYNTINATHSTILGGISNTINSTASYSSIIAGSSITATSPNTAYAKGVVIIDLSANTTSNSQVNVTPEGRLIRGNFVIKSSGITNSLFVGSPLKYTVIFQNNYADANYSISIVGEDSRNWSFENKTLSGFTICTNSSTALTGTTTWTTVPYQS